ncbi:DeoR/GlpR family DNA-binding transcription regulator [Clostridium sp. LIBA-8841]|uniref:DeoR/GlpR family DNA-binding transcription regulator n=1 Tax=Clostridium sp. LIBA-8841 TaxID=2987530 RepID=UPI002AC639D5|nr:DeoR/GlpR family DNA-binding transcription regulator [Clostridium sp. LIBA-8841]MDZ5254269.1 DeoR/GlpR family DNA-binding transcription regulator [Clostridium sp. LIBA-8841]
MLSEKRHEIILNLLKLKGFVGLNELLESTESSESTIRRDLSYLESINLLKRVHGGAKSLDNVSKELSYNEKSSKSIHEKRAIAKYAASLIKDGDCIFIDAGTTTYELIDYLENKDIFVVSNGLSHIDTLIQKNIKCYMIGGNVKISTKAITGSDALMCLSKFRFDKCFIGANGVHPTYGLTTPDTEEAILKECAIKNSRKSYLLVDDSKFGEISTIKFADIDKCIIVTNEKPEDNTYDKKTDIKVVDI